MCSVRTFRTLFFPQDMMQVSVAAISTLIVWLFIFQTGFHVAQDCLKLVGTEEALELPLTI